MRDAVICEPIRTPVGGFGGSLKALKAHELGATVIRALLDRTGLDGAEIDDVIFGSCYPTMDAPALGRVVGLGAIASDLRDETPTTLGTALRRAA
nr:hypothetical protein [Micromonospora sp. DSM 115978]